MIRSLALFGALTLGLTVPLAAQEPKPADPKAADVKPADSKVTAVTVYQQTALVTREVAVPDGMGLTEVVVSPLPPTTLAATLYAEGSDGIRVLSARYRTRAIAEDTRKEVRDLEAKIKELAKKQAGLQADLAAAGQNTAFIAKLEGFTAATLTSLTDKGQLDSEKTIALANFIRETRTKAAKEETSLKQQIETVQEDLSFAQRQLQEMAGGRTRTERDAVIVLDKTRPGAGTVRLNYLVSNATWRPQYKLRAGAKTADPVQLEYLAAVSQNSGEDWTGVALTLSTAQPLLSAAPPDLRALEVTVSPAGMLAGAGFAGQGGFSGQLGQPGGFPKAPGSQSVQPMPQAAGGDMPSRMAYLNSLEAQTRDLRKQAVDNLNTNRTDFGGKLANDAAALDQYKDLLTEKEDLRAPRPPVSDLAEAPSVTFRLKDKLSLPARSDEQVIEVARLELAPKFYYKAVPVLTQQVFRLADLTNTTDFVLLPGEATMYQGTDFVGQTKVPLVAIGKPFTVGFGADPQLQVSRRLMDKTRTVQGGNQLLSFKYRILLSSYKPGPVDVQVWDRLPYTEASQAIGVTVARTTPELSTDALYVRDERPKNLLRWDVKVEPKQNGEKALAIEYEFKLELAVSVNISAFMPASSMNPQPAPAAPNPPRQ